MSLNKYEEEKNKDTLLRNALIFTELGVLYTTIRDKSLTLASKVKAKAGSNTDWFGSNNRAKSFAIKVNKDLRIDYLKVDNFVKSIYEQEYNTSYFYAKYSVENQGIASGYKFKLPKYSKQQFYKALDSSMSVIMDNAEKTIRRKVATKQVYSTILEGISQGLTIDDMNKKIDVTLGFRDPVSKKWIAKPELRKGQQYKTRRTLLTEIGRIRKRSEMDQWKNEQPIVKSDKQILAVRDNRTRKQSIDVDRRLANKDGKFLYPDDKYYYPGETFHKEWDIYDREYVITIDPQYPPDSIIERDKDGNNKVVPFRSFEEYAKDNNLTRNVYGEYLFKKH